MFWFDYAPGIRSRPKRIICASVWGSCAKDCVWKTPWIKTLAPQAATSGLSYCSMNAAVLGGCLNHVLLSHGVSIAHEFEMLTAGGPALHDMKAI